MVSTYEQDLLVVRQRIVALENVAAHPFCYLNESDLQAELFALLLPKFSTPCLMTKTFVWGTDSPKPLRDLCSRRLHSELLMAEKSSPRNIGHKQDKNFGQFSRSFWTHSI